MSRGTAPYRCDAEGCDKQRGNDSNNWLLVSVETDFFEYGNEPVLVFMRWNCALADRENMHHVCGQNHASLLLARWMSNRTLDAVHVSDPTQTAVRG